MVSMAESVAQPRILLDSESYYERSLHSIIQELRELECSATTPMPLRAINVEKLTHFAMAFAIDERVDEKAFNRVQGLAMGKALMELKRANERRMAIAEKLANVNPLAGLLGMGGAADADD